MSHPSPNRTARQRPPVDDNPSMTVTRLSGAHSASTKSPKATNQSFRASTPGQRQAHDDRQGYASLSVLPLASNNTSSPRKSSTHKLGTLRSSAQETRLYPQRQRDIALSALRTGDHWSTTYGNDYTKQFSRR